MTEEKEVKKEKPKCPKCGSVGIGNSLVFTEHLWCRLCDEYFPKPKTTKPCQMERRIGALYSLVKCGEKLKKTFKERAFHDEELIKETIVTIDWVLEEFEDSWK